MHFRLRSVVATVTRFELRSLIPIRHGRYMRFCDQVVRHTTTLIHPACRLARARLPTAHA